MGSMNEAVKANEVLLLGLEQTGKTTFLKRLLDSSLDVKGDIQLEKTDGCNFASATIYSTEYDFWDIGGNFIARSYWRSFYRLIKAKSILYFINLSQNNSHQEALKDLLYLVNEEELKQTRICIIFNCFLEKDEMIDKNYNMYKEQVISLLDKLKQYPIYNYENRIIWEILDVKKQTFTEAMIEKCLNSKEKK